MKQDKGKKMVVSATGILVTITSKWLCDSGDICIIETKSKNGDKHWYYGRELQDYIF